MQTNLVDNDKIEFSQITDTKQRIIEVGIYLFGIKGYAGTSTREISKIAKVNLASVNYHFQSKQNLLHEVVQYVVNDFKLKMKSISQDESLSCADFAVKIYEALIEDENKCLNHFKMLLDSEDGCSSDLEPYPVGLEQMSQLMKKEISADVPFEELVWANNVIFSYIVHVAVMSSTKTGKKHIEKYLPQKKDSFYSYIRKLVDGLIRDLNARYPIIYS